MAIAALLFDVDGTLADTEETHRQAFNAAFLEFRLPYAWSADEYEVLRDAMENPDNYPQLTVRVSGYAVNFVKLTKEQQLDILSRTFHGSR